MPGDLSTAVSLGGALVATAHAIKPFIDKILGPGADEIGDHLRLKVRGYLAENTASTVAQASAMVEAVKAEPKEIPLRSAVPLLEGAAHEDNPQMREMWAALIARAAIAGDNETVPPIYAGILAQLTPAAAVVLSVLATHSDPRIESARVVHGAVEGGLTMGNLIYFLGEQLPEDSMARLGEITDILVRQQLATKSPIIAVEGAIFGDREGPLRARGYDLRITELGRRFYQSCRPPSST